MASSSSTTYNNKFDVFPSYHGPDVRAGFLSHLRKQFSLDKIKMFNDQGIEKSQKIASSLKRAIRESKISIVILSKNYASSSWCLYELVEILECAKAEGHVVTTIFYGVDPYDVQNQTGDFGIAFNETFAMKTVAERWKWRQALTYVSKIPGEHLLNWFVMITLFYFIFVML